MSPNTLLLRQVHPNWLKDGHVLSIAFRPFPKDQGLLSVYNGDLTTAERSWQHYVGELGHNSGGVWAVTLQETTACGLSARADAEGHFPEHAVIDFTVPSNKDHRTKSKLLAARAEERGCVFRP